MGVYELQPPAPVLPHCDPELPMRQHLRPPLQSSSPSQVIGDPVPAGQVAPAGIQLPVPMLSLKQHVSPADRSHEPDLQSTLPNVGGVELASRAAASFASSVASIAALIDAVDPTTATSSADPVADVDCFPRA